MVFRSDNVWADLVSGDLLLFCCERSVDFSFMKSPPVSAVRTNPLPPVTPDFDTSGPGGHWGDYSPGGGISYHQPTEQWTDASVQRADASTSLAVAKPNNTENNNQSEVSNFLPLQKLCSVVMASTIVKQPSCVKPRGRVRPPQNSSGNIPAPRADLQSVKYFFDGAGIPNPPKEYVNSSKKGVHESFLRPPRLPSHRAFGRYCSRDQRTNQLDHQGRANEEKEGGTPRVL